MCIGNACACVYRHDCVYVPAGMFDTVACIPFVQEPYLLVPDPSESHITTVLRVRSQYVYNCY